MRTILRHPTAWLPIVLSLAGLSLVLVHLARHGIVHEADEGAAAHLWQILMAGQVPLVFAFAVTWLPRNPRRAWLVLALQAAAGLASCAAVFFFTK